MLQALALQGVVERLGAGEEVVVALDDLPAGVEAQFPHERHHRLQDLGDAAALAGGVDVHDPQAGQQAGQLAQADPRRRVRHARRSGRAGSARVSPQACPIPPGWRAGRRRAAPRPRSVGEYRSRRVVDAEVADEHLRQPVTQDEERLEVGVDLGQVAR